MNEKTSDRRVRKTKKALRESLAVLMAQKNIREISVQELADQADINRATFYLHYKDIYDLQQKIEDEVAGEINQILQEHMPDKLNSRAHSLFVALLEYIMENASLCGMLLSKNSSRTFLFKLCGIVEDRILKNWLDHHANTDGEALSYLSSYMVFGYVAVISRWVELGMKTPPAQLADLMEGLGLQGIGCLGAD